MSWAPFNSVINNHDIMSDIKDKESYINKPEYTEEQLEELEFKVINAYTSKDQINIYYYQNHKSICIKGVINKIDSVYKRIYINNISINFFDIIRIK
jgi:hypothetical protein